MENSQTARTHLNMQIAAGALLTAAVLGIYAQSLGFDFIDLDDGVYVTQNPVVRAGLTAKGVAWAFQTLHGGFWIPLTWIFLMADQSLFGGGAWGFHLTNMLLHLANSLLVLWILSSLTKSFRLSLLSALIFAVHPLHVESVCWVSERKDVLFAFFFLFAVGAHGRYAHSRKRAWLAWTFCAGFLSLAAKPMAVTLPFILLILDYWPLNRFSRESARSLIVEKIPLALMCLGFGLITLYAQNLYRGVQSLDAVPLAARVGGAVYAYGWYALKSLWPLNLGVFYPHAGMDLPVYQAVSAGFFFAAATGLAWRFRKRLPWLTGGWFFFIVALLPVIGLVQSGLQGRADRFMYIPLLGLIIGAVWTGDWLIRKRDSLAKPGIALTAAFVIFLFVVSTMQAAAWKDSITLYAHTLDVTRKNYMVHEYLGSSLAARGRSAEAAEEYKKALAINPRHGDAWYGLGCLAVNRGEFEEGAECFKQALMWEPDHVEALFGLATAQMQLGDVSAAVKNLKKVLAADPGHVQAGKSLQTLMDGTSKAMWD
ncbi:Tetratricopeptide TPR_2 repeat protein [Desulfatibacillum aliphaticivorans]|uniref:Tetratricopeptide TPR_2 repeat protein n=1 Tax=Desulfatibacillum aliphaticivorans TaxID=218208 RepID=B8FM98_DESAL|nr:tetratricopeptide repeat protein [Desulfatibacillum aliphaticivorans]ACL05936.1 Tetratricopeptide TPR_2 repeat protein [Desulfatibacillum aliphaticivorans]